MKSSRVRPVSCLFLALSFWGMSTPAPAADGTWSKLDGGLWGESGNWTGGVIADGAGFRAILSGLNIPAARVVTLNASRTIGSVIIGDNSQNTDRSSYTLDASGGAALTFDNGAFNSTLIQVSTSNGDTVTLPIILNSSLSLLNNASDRNFTINGTMTSNTAGVKLVTLTGVSPPSHGTSPLVSNATSGTVILNSILSDGTGAGKLGILVDSHGAGNLHVNGDNSFSGGTTINSGTLTINHANALGAGGTLTVNGGILNSTASGRLTLTGLTSVFLNENFSFGGSQTLDIGGGPTVATVRLAKDITITTLGGLSSIYGNITDNGNGYKLVKTGFGNLYLTGTNTHSGGMVIESGIVVFSKIEALGTGGRNILVKNGAVFSPLYTFDQNTLNRLDTASVGVVAPWASSLTLSAALDFSALPNMRFGAASGTATYSGNLTPYANLFKLGGGGGTLVITSGLSGVANAMEAGVKGVASGNLTLSGNNTYEGATTIQGQIVVQLNGNTGRLADSSDLIFDATATFNYDNTGASGAITEVVGDLIFRSGEATVQSVRTTNNNTTLTFASMTREAGATANFTVSGSGATSALNKVTLTSAPTAGTFINQGIFVGGSNYAAYDSTGYLRALSYGTDTDTATAGAGTTMTAGSSGKHVNQTGTITAQTTDSIKSLRIGSAITTTLASGATLTISEGGILKTGGNAATISGGTGITTGGSKELVIRTDVAADTLTINSNILSTTTGGITKSGLGVLVLAGNNSYTGTTTINDGTLRAVGTTSLSASDVVINKGTLDLRINGSNPGSNNGDIESFNFGNNVKIAGDSTIALNTVPGNTTQANKIIQLGNLNIGSNTLTITPNANTGYGLEFTGTTTLESGFAGITTFSINTTRPSNLVQNLILSGRVTGSSQINIRGTGTLQMTNASNDFVGNIHISGGVLAVSNDGAMGNAANQIKLIDATSSTFRAVDTFSTNRTFVFGNNLTTANVIQVARDKTLTINSAFQGNNGFVKSDNGTLELAANNSAWNGDLLVMDGVLKVSHNEALGSASGFTQVLSQESAVQLNGVTTNENFILYSSGLNSSGALQALAGSGVNTVSGSITLNGAASIGVQAGATLNLTSSTAITGNTDVSTNSLLNGNFVLTLTGEGEGTVHSAISTGNSSLTKLGKGTWTLRGSNVLSGNVTVNDGTLILKGADGKVSSGGAWLISPGATVVVDNTDGHLNNRLGTKGIHFGGNLTIIGSASAATVETITNSNLVVANTASVLTLDAHANQSLTFQTTGGTSTFTRSAQGTALFRGDNLGNAPGAGVATMKAVTAPTFIGQGGAAGAINRGILPWAIVDQSVTGLGTAFATYNTTNGIMALNAVAGEQLDYIHGTANVALDEVKGALAPYTVNSLNLGSGGGVEIQPLTALTIESGGLLAFTGNQGIHGGFLQTSSNRELIVHALGDLEVTAVVANFTSGLTKTGAGTMTLGASNLYTGATTVNQGVLKLDGGDHTLFSGQILNVNHGGTLDLNGNAQLIGTLRSLGSSGGEAPQNGGTITSSSGTGTLVTHSYADGSTLYTFAGKITGNVNLVRTNTNLTAGANNTQALTSENNYTGGTLLTGGITSVRNGGKLTMTSGIDVQYSALRLENNFLSDDGDRIGDNIDITLKGGTVSLYGRGGAHTSETIGDVSLEQGVSFITSAAGSNNSTLMPQSATLTLNSLSRNVAAGATVNFGQSYAGTSAERLGLLASGTGSAENILVNGGLATTNNIIGAWAITTNYFNSNSIEFVGYNSQTGVGALSAVGYAGYDSATLPGTSQPNQNIRLVASATVATGGLNINTLNLVASSSTASPVITFGSATDVLNLTAGGLAVSQDNAFVNQPKIGAVPNQGRITAGGVNPTAPVDLFVYYQGSATTNILTINSAIIDNPTNGQKVRLIVNGTVFGQFPVVLASNQNSYTGGTIVNGQTLHIGNADTAGNLVGGGLVINGGTVTQVNGTIAAQDVTLNGPSVMTLIGNNTLNNLTFDNNGGGHVAPRLNVGSGVLTLNGNVTASSANAASTSIITGGTLSLGGSTRTFDINPVEAFGEIIAPDLPTLHVASVITGSGVGIVKTGEGLLQLSGASTFSGGVDLQEGGLMISASSTGGVTSGPLGTGTLTIGDNTTITADSVARTIANAVSVNGDFTMGVRGGPMIIADLTLSGGVAWGSATRGVTVNSAPSVVNTISGAISGSGGIVKKGIGTLAITANNSATLNWSGAGAVTVEEGTLRINSDLALGETPSSATAGNIVLNGGALSASASFTLNSNRGIALGDAAGSGTGVIEVANAAHTLTYAGIIADNGTGADHLLKTGAGKLQLNGANTYTGNTTIGVGTLALGANGSMDQSRQITVVGGATYDVTAVTGGYNLKTGQTLEGGGTIKGAFTAQSGSVIAPGTSVNHVAEKLRFENGLNLLDGSRVEMQITTATFTSTTRYDNHEAGSAGYQTYIFNNRNGQGEHDQLEIVGTLNQETGAKIVVLGNEFIPRYGQIFNLLDWSAAFNGSSNMGLDVPYRDGAWDNGYDLDLPDISAYALLWDVSNFAGYGVLSIVPEPSRAMLLLLAGVYGLCRRRRNP